MVALTAGAGWGGGTPNTPTPGGLGHNLPPVSGNLPVPGAGKTLALGLRSEVGAMSGP